MIGNLVEQVLSKAQNSIRGWAKSEEDSEGIVIYPKDGGAPVYLTGHTVIDGLESFAEFSLKHDDAKFRDTARKIKREQYGAIRLNKKIVSAIVQHGVFGEVVF